MSFAVSCARCRLEYSARAPLDPAADRAPARHGAAAGRDRALPAQRRGARSGSATRRSTSATTCASRATRAASATTSSSRSPRRSGRPRPDRTLDFPAAYAVRFFENHGLLGLPPPPLAHRRRRQPPLRRARSPARLGDRLHLGLGVRAMLRDADGVSVRTDDDRVRRFDAVVVATHADQALAMLGDADDLERARARRVPTTPNRPCSTPTRACCRARRRRAAVVELPGRRLRAPSAARPSPTTSTSSSALDEPEHYCVTLNRDAQIAPEDRVLARFAYAHPLYTFASPGRAGPAAAARRPAAHVVRRRVPRLRLPRGRARLGRARRGRARGAVVRSALYEGTLLHARHDARRATSSATRSASTALDLDELPALDRRLRALRLQPPERRRRSATRDHLAARPAGEGERRRSTSPAGSVRRRAWCCSPTCACSATSSTRSASSTATAPTARWRAIVAEVGNTFGERHPYLLAENRVAGSLLATSTASGCTSRRSSGWTRRYRFSFTEPGDEVRARRRRHRGRRAPASGPSSPAGGGRSPTPRSRGR